MAKQTRSATGKEDLTVVADRGYFYGPEILECDQAGMTPLVPKPLTSNSKARGRFDKRDCVYTPKTMSIAARPPTGHQALYHHRPRHDPAQVLVLGLSQMSAQSAMHDEPI